MKPLLLWVALFTNLYSVHAFPPSALEKKFPKAKNTLTNPVQYIDYHKPENNKDPRQPGFVKTLIQK